jgi:histidine triad (HIT) family protein
MARGTKGCVFCEIAKGAAGAEIVLEDETAVAFLDHRPLLPGHCLLIPKVHVETLPDLPEDLLPPISGTSRSSNGPWSGGSGPRGRSWR